MEYKFYNFLSPYFLVSSIVFSSIFATSYFGCPIYLMWIIYAFVPVVDYLLPNDLTNPSEDEQKELEKQWKWKIPLYLFIVIEWYILFWGVNLAANGELTPLKLISHLLSMGHIGAIGILVAHEIFHKADSFSRFLGWAHMSKYLYMHFFSEHLYGHHKNVATPLDPATSRYNQTVYSFILSSIKGGFVLSWERETEKVKKRGQAVWGLENPMIRWILIQLGLCALMYYLYDLIGLAYFVIQAFLAVFILEMINYIEHYGLVRKEINPGQYEPVTIKHSWNAPSSFQNILLMKLQRHSDHHAHSLKPYQTLCSYEESPTLPCGYAVCLMAILFPNVWFKIVNPLAKQANANGVVDEKELKESQISMRNFTFCQAAVYTFLLLVI
jgi:alkane 1-monooxygenase